MCHLGHSKMASATLVGEMYNNQYKWLTMRYNSHDLSQTIETALNALGDDAAYYPILSSTISLLLERWNLRSPALLRAHLTHSHKQARCRYIYTLFLEQP